MTDWKDQDSPIQGSNNVVEPTKMGIGLYQGGTVYVIQLNAMTEDGPLNLVIDKDDFQALLDLAKEHPFPETT